jgi:hypothetical protein
MGHIRLGTLPKTQKWNQVVNLIARGEGIVQNQRIRPSLAWSRPRGKGIVQNQRINPMQSKLPMHRSQRCLARRRRGSPCQSPAMPNGRCRMHGGPSPGAPKGNKNAYKHGRYTAKTIADRRAVAALNSPSDLLSTSSTPNGEPSPCRMTFMARRMPCCTRRSGVLNLSSLSR